MNDKSLSKNFFYIIENYYYIIITHQFPTIKMVNPIFHLYKKKFFKVNEYLYANLSPLIYTWFILQSMGCKNWRDDKHTYSSL